MLAPQPSRTHLRLGAAVRVVLGRQVGDDEAVVTGAVHACRAHAPQGELLHLPSVRTLGHIGDNGVGEARHHHVI